MTGKWDVFDLLGKPALFNLLTDEQAATVPYETNPLLYHVNEEGVWVFWSILENDWTMDEILEIRLDVEEIMLGAALVVEEHAVQLTGLGNEDIAVGDAVEVIAGDDDTVSADEEKDLVKPMRMQMMV